MDRPEDTYWQQPADAQDAIMHPEERSKTPLNPGGFADRT